MAEFREECNWLKNLRHASLAPKTSPSGVENVGEIQNVVGPTHEVARFLGDRQIDVRLIFGIPVESEDTLDFRSYKSSLCERCKESIDYRVCQRGKLLAHSGTRQRKTGSRVLQPPEEISCSRIRLGSSDDQR